MLNVEKFTKVLGLTTSPADGEALNAIRIANKMLSDEKLTWNQVIITTGPLRPGERIVRPQYEYWGRSVAEDLRRRAAQSEMWQDNPPADEPITDRASLLKWIARRHDHLSNSERIIVGALFLKISFDADWTENEKKHVETIYNKLKRKGL